MLREELLLLLDPLEKEELLLEEVLLVLTLEEDLLEEFLLKESPLFLEELPLDLDEETAALVNRLLVFLTSLELTAPLELVLPELTLEDLLALCVSEKR